MSPIQANLTILASIILAIKYPPAAVLISLLWVGHLCISWVVEQFRGKGAPKPELP